tara:strand:- start:359 stop:1186 length:828 start_codon:yes stop_codon:yes gene_type:complete
MTIKQYGGVFGRNPTFNDVTIEGDLIINGEVFTGLDFQGSWNASTNTPTLASGTGTKGEFYIVSVAGTTNLDGITNWGIGDWALFNGTVWQRVEGGADGNFNALTANSLLVNGDATVTGGNLIIGTSGKGIDFSATAGTGTSELLDDYEEGTFLPSIGGNVATGTGTYTTQQGLYTKIGNVVTIYANVTWSGHTGSGSGIRLAGLPFTSIATYSSVLNGRLASITLSANSYFAGALVRTSDTSTDLFQATTGGTGGGLIAFDTSGTVQVSGQYYI